MDEHESEACERLNSYARNLPRTVHEMLLVCKVTSTTDCSASPLVQAHIMLIDTVKGFYFKAALVNIVILTLWSF